MGDSDSPYTTEMKTFIFVIFAAAVMTATSESPYEHFRATDMWGSQAASSESAREVAQEELEQKAPTMDLIAAVKKLRAATPAELSQHAETIAKHARLIQDDRAKAYKHNFKKSKKAIHGALHMLVGQLHKGHKHDEAILKTTRITLASNLAKIHAGAVKKATASKHKICPLQREEEKHRQRHAAAVAAMNKTGHGRVCPLSTAFGDMDIDKSVPSYGTALRSKWDKIR